MYFNISRVKKSHQWKSKNISLAVITRLYESLAFISTLWYHGAESWPLSDTQMKKLEAAHHKFQRRLLGITRSEMKTPERKLVQGNWKI